jgi:hypothetical protein
MYWRSGVFKAAGLAVGVTGAGAATTGATMCDVLLLGEKFLNGCGAGALEITKGFITGTVLDIG